MRRSSMSRRGNIKGGLALVTVLLLFPFVIPGMIISQVVRRGQLRRKVLSSSCENCGSNLGAKALQLADHESMRAFKEWKAKFPNARFRMVRTVHAVCAACGAKHTYFEKTRILALEKVP